MADDYSMPTQPTPKRNYSIQELFGNVTNVEDEDTFFRGGIYAEPGNGKTWAAVELAQRITPPEKNILFVYTGTNWDSVKDVPQLTKRLKKKPFTSFDEIRDLCDVLKRQDIRDQTKIGCVIFDEFNTMFDINVEYLTAYRSTLPQKGNGYKDPDTPEWPEYNTAKNHMNHLMNDVLATPDIHFIFVAHPRTGKRTKSIEPDFFDKAAQAFMRPLSCLYYLQTDVVDGKVSRSFQLQGTDQITAKNRISGLGPYAHTVKEIAEAYKAWGLGKTPVEVSGETTGGIETAPVAPKEAPTSVEVTEPPQVKSPAPPEVSTNTSTDVDDIMALLA